MRRRPCESRRIRETRSGLISKTSRFRSEEHTSELQSLRHLVCRLLLEKKKETISARKSALHALVIALSSSVRLLLLLWTSSSLVGTPASKCNLTARPRTGTAAHHQARP